MIRFGRLAKGSSWGKTANFQTRATSHRNCNATNFHLARQKMPGNQDSCGLNSSSITSCRLQGSKRKRLSSPQPGGAEIRPLEGDQFR